MKEPRTSKEQIRVAGRFFQRNSKALLVVILLVLLLADVVFVGNIAYGAKWITCRQQPIVLVSGTKLLESYPTRVQIHKSPGVLTEKISPLDNNQLGRHQLFCGFDEAVSEANKLTSPANITIID